MASSRKWSISTGRSCEYSTACFMYSISDSHRRRQSPWRARRARRRPHQHGIGDAVGAASASSMLVAVAPRGCGMCKFLQQLAEAFAVFREVDGFRRSADHRHARSFQRQRQIQRRLSAVLDHHAHCGPSSFVLVYRHHVFQRQRLEVEAIAGVVVGGNRLRVAIDHDGLVTIIVQRESGMAAAVVELDSLADAVRPGAQDDDFLLVGGRRFVFFLVGGIEVRRVALEFGGASVDVLVHRANAELLAQLQIFGAPRPSLVSSARASRASENPMRFDSQQRRATSIGSVPSFACSSVISLS